MPVFGLSALGALWLAAVDAPVTSVTVYSDRARVVRTARVSLSGPQRVELPLLHGSVDPSSIRVEAQGAEVTRVDIRPVNAEALPSTEARRLITELERLEDQLSQLRAERDAYSAQLTLLGRVRPVVPQEPTAPATTPAAPRPSRLDASGWRAATDFLVDSTARLQTKLRELSLREESLERELSQRTQEARKLGATRQRPGVEVAPTLAGQGTATLTLTYFTSGARWYPSYELRLEPEANRVQMAFFGRVSQESGEDWEDAALSLSTAIPATTTLAPKLATWKIGQRERFIPTPAPVADSWRAPPPTPPPPPQAPNEEARLRSRLLAHASQAQARKSTLLGVVINAATREPLADVVVSANATDLGSEQTVVTDAQGQYRIPELPTGVYSLRFEKDSFRPFERSDVQLRPGRTSRVNVELLPEEVLTEELQIVGEVPSIDEGSTNAGVSVEQDFPSEMPMAPPPPPPASVPHSYDRMAGAPSRGEAVSSVGLAPPAAWQRPLLDSRLPASLAGGYALAFSSQRRETVRSGGGERRVPLFTETWPVQVERTLYPALTPSTFLVAELRSPSKQVLPGGEAQLFVGADPAGQAQLSLVSPGESLTLPLGIDSAVRPVRNVQVLTAEKGLLSKDDLTEYLVTIEVANPYPFALPVRIHDQWPLSRHEDVEVKLARTEPYAEQDKDKGTLEWRLTVPPSEKKSVSFVYTVRHPKGWRLQQSQ
jgi:hypothetical protein